MYSWGSAQLGTVPKCAAGGGFFGSFGRLAEGGFVRLRISALALAVVALVGVLFAAPATALALTETIYTSTHAEDVAYDRCLNAAMNYASLPNTTTVDISDLRLTQTQAEDVERRIHSNGELWWVNTFGMKPTTKSLTIPFKYDDATIDAMRVNFEKAVNAALKRIGPAMNGSTKAHMMHDYVIDEVAYVDKAKNAYETLVNKRGDCFGYTLATDVLMHRVGLNTDVAFNDTPEIDHSWNLVQIGNYWYHVDTTWDRYYTVEYYKDSICHKWLLQSDNIMSEDDHAGWLAHHRCTNNAFENSASYYGDFSKHCNDYKKIVRFFTKGGLKYQVTAAKKVFVCDVAKSSRSKKTLIIPATIKYKKINYSVIGINTGAFAKAKTKVLVVKTKKLTKARTKDCFVGSKVKMVQVPKGKLKAYRKIFAASNNGGATEKPKIAKTSSKTLHAA